MHKGRPLRASSSTDSAARPNSAHELRYPLNIATGGLGMKGWTSQIVIGIIVTVVGTVIANAIIRGAGGKHFVGGAHFSGPVRGGR